jgi:hypothetical protein
MRHRQAKTAWAGKSTGSDRIFPLLQTAPFSSSRARMPDRKQTIDNPSTLIQSE